jgi:hypothetical protein
MKLNQEVWGVVMKKIERIAGLVDKFGTACQEHNLEEKDIPRTLRAKFESFVTYVVHP